MYDLLLSDGWFRPPERASRRLPQGKTHLPSLDVPPAVGGLTRGAVFHLQCFSEVSKAFAALEAAIRFGNLSRVAADFNCCEVPKDLDDQVTHKSSESLFFSSQLKSILLYLQFIWEFL